MDLRSLPKSILSVAWLAFATAGFAEDASSLRLVPFPKEVRTDAGSFRLDRPLVVETSEPLAAAVQTVLLERFDEAGLPRPALRPTADRGEDAGDLVILLAPAQVVGWDKRSAGPLEQERTVAGGPSLRLSHPAAAQQTGEEDYALSVTPNAAMISAKAAPGLINGLATLGQLIRANRRDNSILCLTIRDWPSIRWRVFQDDITRGPSTRLDQLRRDVARGRMLKLNVFTYYMQHQFAFTKHPLIGPKDGSLTPAELKKLVTHAGPLGIHVMGNQQSFAHMQHTLAHPEYAALKEDDRTLSPAREGTYELLDDLYSDVLPILPFEYFNVCCDETSGLGKGPSKELAEKIGPGGVYVQHIRRVHDLVHGKYGKRMMMWGDIILQHPDKLDQIPKDVVMLTWGYGPRESFDDQIVPFAESGYEFFVCPGVSNWRRVLPDYRASVVNIGNFVRDGAARGADGVVVTSWDDDGENLNAPNWYGFAWGAECAWNGSKTPIEDFNRRVGAVLFGEPGDEYGRAIAVLSDARVSGLTNRDFWADEPSLESEKIKSPPAEVLDLVRRAIGHLEACRSEAKADADLLEAVLFGARRIEFRYQRNANQLEAAEAYREALDAEPSEATEKIELAAAAIRRTRDGYAELREQWKRLWLAENKPYSLDWSLARYDAVINRYDRLLARLDAARRAAEDGKPLPTARPE